MKTLFFLLSFILHFVEPYAQNRIGIYAMATNTALLNNSEGYSKDVFNSINNQRERWPLHKYQFDFENYKG